MKLPIILSIVLLLYVPVVFGQSLAVNNSAFTHNGLVSAGNYLLRPPYAQEHCYATRMGAVYMITGAAALGLSILYINNRPNDQNLLVLFVAVYGLVAVPVGSALFIGGEIYDHTGARRISIIGKSNEVGLAYNF